MYFGANHKVVIAC